MSTDRDIVVGSQTDPAMFGLLFPRHSDRIFRYAAKRVGAEAAQDIMSETFVVAFRRRARFDTEYEDAGPWLFGIATVLIRRHRAGEARVLRALEAATAAFREGGDGGQAIIERLDAERDVAGLAPAIAALPRRDRETLLLYAWADLDYAGVAAALGVPIGTVRSRLNRVRRKLAAAADAAGIRDLTSADANTRGEGDGCLGPGAPSAI
ncbi:RNA polymerase sigma factor [Gryllotalpicola protaetiae]|uniref:Sigma-70 family RNA polymerase sigma factor n=1 Tax=Gryllotalpicola protaetiae TaxID=2419771 RepID=A0A387C1U5_9MICO|nr:sigma-70 family RNA polymerase sigma factor [Gryllotalpicola protaetiae]AYG04481.1 sigma-70 family RNA polymerase sigma factor [Gryllotalpicola protaetiae]